MRLANLLAVGPSNIHGRGVFARRPVEPDTYLGTYGGKSARRDGTFVLWVESEEGRSGRQGEAPLKFLNHSNQPNTYFDGFDLYAKVAIARGEELTFDYGSQPDFN